MNQPLGDRLAIDAASCLGIAGLGVGGGGGSGVRSNGEVLVHDWLIVVGAGCSESLRRRVFFFRVTNMKK